ncbi:glycosyltransferase family 2 protein [Mycolicibacterium moriokaense]|uniref:glycosyltransferase family 2 protein n=1 Tax=Mycolicibacterium moriokaense TaxID=39691 RepID=UPI000D7616B5|nr:glycosyltransferase family A protein [Mycolicibacterium moriokaense]
MTTTDGPTRPAISVVVPTHNRSALVAQTLESILAQRDVDVQLIVVDDASTDDTRQVLEQYPAVQVVHQPYAMEQRRARNEGAQLASQPWIAFCDDDDLWSPVKLSRQVDALMRTTAEWCTCSSLSVDEHLNPVGGQRLRHSDTVRHLITKQNVVPGGGSGVVMSTAAFRDVGGFREDAKFVEDWDLWIRLSKRGDPVCVDELLLAQRQWAKSYSHQAFNEQFEAFADVVRRYAADTDHAKPRHLGDFEVRRRLLSEKRVAIVRDLPRILRNAPEDRIPVLAMMLVPDRVRRPLGMRQLGREDVRAAVKWLATFGKE